MNREEIIYQISLQMNTGRGKLESLHAYKSVRNYFADLSMDDLIAIASQYGIVV